MNGLKTSSGSLTTFSSAVATPEREKSARDNAQNATAPSGDSTKESDYRTEIEKSPRSRKVLSVGASENQKSPLISSHCPSTGRHCPSSHCRP